MVKTPPLPELDVGFPDHTQLPESDGTFVKNFQEHPQTLILTDSIGPVLQQLHPDGQYLRGQDCGIYWRETDPPQQGAEAPDWFYVPDVPPLLEGEIRRSYVLPREYIPPFIAIELASGDGREERDTTSLAQANAASRETQTRVRPGKFWVYERVMRIPYYGIFIVGTRELAMYRLVEGRYQTLSPNDRGHYPIPLLGVELGLWQGGYQNQSQTWLRWWDGEGNLLLTGWEQVCRERDRVEAVEKTLETTQQALQESQSEVDRLKALMKARGIDPNPQP